MQQKTRVNVIVNLLSHNLIEQRNFTHKLPSVIKSIFLSTDKENNKRVIAILNIIDSTTYQKSKKRTLRNLSTASDNPARKKTWIFAKGQPIWNHREPRLYTAPSNQ
jgi:hypothetical protein